MQYKISARNLNLNSNLAESRSSITSISVVQSFWNFAQRTAVILLCTKLQSDWVTEKNVMGKGVFTRFWYLGCVSGGCPILVKASINRNVDKPKRRQTKTSTTPNVDKSKRRQTKTLTDQNLDKPKRRQTETSTLYFSTLYSGIFLFIIRVIYYICIYIYISVHIYNNWRDVLYIYQYSIILWVYSIYLDQQYDKRIVADGYQYIMMVWWWIGCKA